MPYLHFTLKKLNMDTNSAIDKMSKFTRKNVKSFSVAGTKVYI